MGMILDFSTNTPLVLPQSTILEDWQQPIVDFVKEYQQKQQITVHTSGSTGTPKTIQLPKQAMQQSARLTAEFFGLKKGDTALLCLPVSYIAGKMMVVRAIELGMKLYCIAPKVKLNLQQKIHFAALTPMQAEHSLQSFSSLDIAILGGAPVKKTLEKKLIGKPVQVYETYGMTETITHIALRELNVSTTFKLLPQMQISQDERGCLAIKTPYSNETIITNDVVEIYGESQFKWLGRADNIINSGGIKIIPETIEAALKPYIKSAYIISSEKDEVLGEKLILIIEGEKYNVTYPEEVLPKNQRPKKIYFIDEFLRTESGKIQRKQSVQKIWNRKK